MGFQRTSFILSLAVATFAWAGPAARGQDADEPVIDVLNLKATQFLNGIAVKQEGAVEKSFDDLLANGPLRGHTEKIVASMKELDKFGDFRESHLIAKRRIGDDLVLLQYLAELERYPVIWYFTFYRAYKKGDPPPAFDQNWMVVNVRFSTKLDSLAIPPEK